MMKTFLVTLSAMFLACAVGCDDKKPAAGDKKGVDIKAGNVEVKTGDKADGGGAEVTTPGANVDVNTKEETK